MNKNMEIKNLPFKLPEGWDLFFYHNPNEFIGIQQVGFDGKDCIDVYGYCKVNRKYRLRKVCRVFRKNVFTPVMILTGLLGIYVSIEYFVVFVLTVLYLGLLNYED